MNHHINRRQFLAGILLSALQKDRLESAATLVERAVAHGEASAVALHVRQGDAVLRRGFGLARSPEAIFLLASITKPMTAAGVMILADRGELSLGDPVRRFLPEFAGGDRDLITVHQLLTHTSGLPDMLPENETLRQRHAPLSEFVAATCKTPLLFKPGTRVSYQSMGILLAAEICERITRQPFRAFLRRELFEPLGMKRTFLGLGGLQISDTMRCEVSGNDDWNWNSSYWRNLGAPWGGAHGSAPDIARFLELFLHPDGRVLKKESAARMIVDHNAGLDDPRGLGWMIKPGSFGKACSARTFGHYGSTGTVAWADPASDLTCVLLTTKPAAESRDTLLKPVSDRVSESRAPGS